MDANDIDRDHVAHTFHKIDPRAPLDQTAARVDLEARIADAAAKLAAAETDPHGMDAHEPGAKLDFGKPRPGLVLGDFAHALERVVEVGTYGANKYTDHGWLSVPNAISRYLDAAGRHRLKRERGEEIDDESGLPHLAHEAWNVLAVLELLHRAETPQHPTAGEE